MSHTIHQKKKLIARVSRIRGQLEAVERALEGERPCGEILQLLASVRGALTGLTGEVLEFALSALPDEKRGSSDSDELLDGIRQKLLAGDQLSDYKYHVFVEVILLHVRLSAGGEPPRLDA